MRRCMKARSYVVCRASLTTGTGKLVTFKCACLTPCNSFPFSSIDVHNSSNKRLNITRRVAFSDSMRCCTLVEKSDTSVIKQVKVKVKVKIGQGQDWSKLVKVKMKTLNNKSTLPWWDLSSPSCSRRRCSSKLMMNSSLSNFSNAFTWSLLLNNNCNSLRKA